MIWIGIILEKQVTNLALHCTGINYKISGDFSWQQYKSCKYHINFEAVSISIHGNSDLNNDTCHMEFQTTQKHKLQPKLKLLCISMLMAWGKNRMKKKKRSISHWEHAQWFWKLFHRTHHNRNTFNVCETQHKISVIENLLRVSTWCTVNYVGTPQKGGVYY